MNSESTYQLAPHELRVVAEREQRNGELDRLGKFIDENPVFKNLHSTDQYLLHQQRKIMAELVEVLDKRIARFGISDTNRENHQ